MSKYSVVVFPDESKAYEGVKALRDLHGEGSLSLYAAAVIAKDADGTVSMKGERDEGPVGLALGMLTGGLIGALVGPAGAAAGAAAAAAATGAAVGMASGGLLGTMFDLVDVGVGLDFIDEVGRKMDPGTAAVVAEIEEYWTIPLDTKMEALGGTVFRRWRVDVEDDQFYRDVVALNAELDELDAEIDEAADEAKSKLQAKRDALKKKLDDTKGKAKKKADAWEKEAKAKVEHLKKQAADAKADAKAKIVKRIEEIEAKHDARVARLKEAFS
jgi:uncharacterized membrane protein